MNTNDVQSPMQFLGEDPTGRKWYFADDSFTKPGVYFWDGKDNVHVQEYIEVLVRTNAGHMDELQKAFDQVKHIATERDAALARAEALTVERDELRETFRLSSTDAYRRLVSERDTALAELAAARKDSDRLKELLKKAWSLPEFPSPGEGEVSDDAICREQDEWRERFMEINKEVTEALK